jgi:two-component system chemotaxis sensor kinase CheA
MTVELREFVTAFLGEAEDLLRTASGSLLAIEAEVRRGRNAPRPLREAFRAVHTLKGLAAMVGIEPIVTLAHRMEAVLRQADRSGGVIGAPAIDALLQGVREIERRVQAVSQGKAPPEPPQALLDALDALDTAAPATPPPPAALALEPALQDKLTGYEREGLAQAVAAGRRALRVDFVPSPARAQAGLNITTVRERMAAVAEIVKVVPRSVPASPDAPGGLAFTLIVLAAAPDEEIAAAAGLAPGALVALGAPVPAPTPAPARAAAAPPRAADAPVEAPPPEYDPAAEAGQRASVVRVEVSRLDDAMERLSALIVTRFRMTRAVARLAEDGADVRELSALLADTTRGLRDMRAAILRVRMVRVAEVLERIPLLVRGLRRETGKAVRVEMDGGHAELDKAVAERLVPALVHLVRNAVDHAIEPAAERARAGKPEEGTLTISCFQRGNTQLELTVADDGAGVDRAAVARRAGVEPPASDAALLDLLCRPGLSTRSAATTTSGRGMGMDIVRRTVVEELGGELLLRTEPGRGSAFTLRVPLTISIVECFGLESAGRRYVVPVASVEEILDLDGIRRVEGPAPRARHAVAILERRGEAVPLVALSAVFGLAGDPPRKALVVRRAGEPIAFGVDRMTGQHEVVLRSLEDPLVKRPGIAGATDLGDGRPTLVLDLVALGGAAVGPAEVNA